MIFYDITNTSVIGLFQKTKFCVFLRRVRVFE